MEPGQAVSLSLNPLSTNSHGFSGPLSVRISSGLRIWGQGEEVGRKEVMVSL